MWPNPQFRADLVTFTEEILQGKLHFFGSENGYFVTTFTIFMVVTRTIFEF